MRHHRGAALAPDAIKLSARQVLEVPLPADTVAWDRATDPDLGDSVTYTIWKGDAKNPWSEVAKGVSGESVNTNLADGTCTFAIKAVDSKGLESNWVGSTAQTKVDRGKPTAPGDWLCPEHRAWTPNLGGPVPGDSRGTWLRGEA